MEFYIPLKTILELDKGSILDISAIRSPLNIDQTATIKWFALDRHAEAFRDHLKPMIEQETAPRLMAIVLGFPRFSRFENSAQRTQISGLMPIWAYLQRVSDPPPIIVNAVPKVIFELDHLEEKSLPVNASTFVRKSFQQFQQNMCLENESVLGGYSGGPLIYFCEQGPFLVGIMTDGGMSVGGQGFATPIDVFVESIRHHPNWWKIGDNL